MTPEQITRINELCATEIMEWRPICMKWFSDRGSTGYMNQRPYYATNCKTCTLWSPYTNIAQAMEVADAIDKEACINFATVVNGGVVDVECEMSFPSGRYGRFIGEGKTRAAALTLACLRAAKIEIPRSV